MHTNIYVWSNIKEEFVVINVGFHVSSLNLIFEKSAVFGIACDFFSWMIILYQIFCRGKIVYF